MKSFTEEQLQEMSEIILKGNNKNMKIYKISFFNVETQRDEWEFIGARSVREAVDVLEVDHASRGTIVQVFKVEEKGDAK